MSIPKYKEHGADKHRRLSLGKAHIYWSRKLSEWLTTGADSQENQFCHAQDNRWTPRSKQ